MESAPQAGQALAVKFQFGKGLVYHSVITHLISKVGSQGGTNFQTLADMLPIPSNEIAKNIIKELQEMKTPLKTLSAFNTALSCGYSTCINLSKSFEMTFDCLFTMILTHSSNKN